MAAGITLYKASTLGSSDLLFLLNKTAKFQIPSNIKLLLKDLKALKKEPKQYMALFNGSADNIRKKLDLPLKKEHINAFAKSEGFATFVKKIVFGDRYDKLALSLLQTKSSLVKGDTAFYLALEAMKRGYKNVAVDFLKSSRKSYFRHKIDRANFWLYKLTGDKRYKKELLKSWDNNLYALLIKEEESVDPDFITFKATGRKRIDITDPFLQQKILKGRPNKERFFYTNTLGIYSYLVERESRYRLQPYIFPFRRYLKADTKRTALIYSIMRQESRYLPASISPSYALGLMQFMPFLAKHTAKELKIKNFDLDMMFGPKTALKFANRHLDYLEKNLENPLFIAYAYNGGIGFTKRDVLPLFEKYPALLAMELVPYQESREYGKKVLANYAVYSKILKQDFSLNRFFQKLK